MVRVRRRRSDGFRKVLASLGMAALIGGVAVASPSLAAAAHADDSVGCGYGTGGPHADTICWIDMAGVDPARAEAPGGQQMQIQLGAYTMTFTAEMTAGTDGFTPLRPTSFPTFERSVIGNNNNVDGAAYYVNTPGRPALYQDSWNAPAGGTSYARGEVTLKDIVITDSTGATFSGDYSLIMADAESTGYSEGFSYTSDTPIRELARLTPTNYAEPCVGELTGIGTTEVSCVGGDSGGNTYRGALMVAADKPSTVTASFLNGGRQAGATRQGVAFGVMVSRLEVSKVIDGRADARDQFTVSASESGEVIASATTEDEASSVTTGPASLLSNIGGNRITFEERAASSSVDWDRYSTAWQCSVNGEPMDPQLIETSADGRSVSAPLGVGEFLDCTVTNTAKIGGVSWSKVDPEGNALAGSEWELVSTGGSSLAIVDNGERDADAADGRFLVEDLPWGEYVLRETAAPKGHVLSKQTTSITIDGKHRDVKIGDIENSRIDGELSWSKVDSEDEGQLLAGSEWELTGPDGTTARIVDNGLNDQDPEPGRLRVTGLEWGSYTLTETRAPREYLLAQDPISVVVDIDHLVIEIPAVKNELAQPGLHILKESDPASGSKVKPGQEITYRVTVKNTGNVDLTPALVDDDLSQVLDHATFIEGTAQATIGGSPAAAPEVDAEGALLHWEDALPVGASATISYRVKVHSDVTDKDRLVNVVTGTGTVPPGITPPPSNCAPGQHENPDCSTTHVPDVPGDPKITVPPTPEKPGLAWTGGGDLLGVSLIGAALCLGAGAILLLRRRASQD